MLAVQAFWLQHAPVLSVLLPAFTAMILLLLGTHIFMTIRTGFIQRKIGTGIKLSVTKDDPSNADGDITQFGALTLEEVQQLRSDELGDLVHLVGIPVLLQRLEVVTRSGQEVLLVEPCRGVDDRSGRRGRCGRTPEDRRLGRLGVSLTLHRRMAWHGHLRLLLVSGAGRRGNGGRGNGRHPGRLYRLRRLRRILR